MKAVVRALIRVTDVEVQEGFVVKLWFEDGAVKVLDLEPMLWGEMFESLRSHPADFAAVEVDERAGTIVWPNGADLSPRALYARAEDVVPA